jgi:hypothetical protein
MQRFRSLIFVVLVGCVGHVRIAPVRVEPIHMTIDVNLHEDPKP